jgi:hypothetical protein
MRATLSFNLPEEQEEFDFATNGSMYHLALWEISQEIFRPARKHGYSETSIQGLVSYLDSLAQSAAEKEGLSEYQDATELVSLLEQKFYDILREKGINI